MAFDRLRRPAALVCLVSAFLAAWTSFALVWVVAAAVAALFLGSRTLEAPEPVALPWPGWKPVAWKMSPGWLLLTLGAAGNLGFLPHRLALALWIAGALSALWGARRLSRLYRTGASPPRNDWRVIACGMSVVVFAAIVRLWSLDSIPWQVDLDEGVMPLLALGVYEDPAIARFAPYLLAELATPSDAVFAPFIMGGYTSMRLYYYVLGAGTQIFGFNVFGVRITDALVGILCIALLFDALRRVSNLTFATVAALLLAANHTHIAFSRVATGNIQTALTVAILFNLLCRVWAAPTFLNTTVFGIALALTVQLYQTSLIAPLLLAASVGVLVALRPQRWRALLASATIFALTCASAAAPFGVAVWKWGDDMLIRARDMGLFAPARMQFMKEVYQTDREGVVVANQLFNALTVFHTGIDYSEPYRVEAPMTDPYTAAFMIPGLVLALLTLRHVAVAPALVFTAGYLLAGLAGVYPIGYQRATGALPLAAIVATLGLMVCVDSLFEGRGRLLHFGRIVALGGVTLLCVATSLKIYFIDYPRSFGDGAPESEAGRIAQRYAGEYRVHLVSWPRRASAPGQPMPGYEMQDVLAGEFAVRPPAQDPLTYVQTVQPAGADLFILLPTDAEAVAALRRRFPTARTRPAGTERRPELLTLVFVETKPEGM